MVHFTIELQTNDGVGAAIPMAYPNQEQAEQKYHQILSAAAVSPVQQHGAIIISADFSYIRREIYDKTTGEMDVAEINGGE